MRKSSPALPKKIFFLIPVIFLLAGILGGQDETGEPGFFPEFFPENLYPGNISPEIFFPEGFHSEPLNFAELSDFLVPSEPVEIRWYISNASGLALEYVPSAVAALRNEYSLSVESIDHHVLPAALVPYYEPGFSVELRTLNEDGKPYRRQWIFRDWKGMARLNASGGFPPDDEQEFYDIEDEDDDEDYEPEEIIFIEVNFIEIYNEDYLLLEEIQFMNNYEIKTDFIYSNNVLLKAETNIENFSAGTIESYTDIYRYTRSASLRSIERVYHGIAEAEAGRLISFPPIIPGMSREPEFENPGLAYSSLFPEGQTIPADARVIYTTDNRGRVLSERRYDDDGELLAELVNTWAGDRLNSIFLKSGDEERLTEYEYDERGSRILERNYNGGMLERVVRTEGNRETEELYMDGRLMLRAVWEDGRKISEERTLR